MAATTEAWARLPLPRLTVSRMDQVGDRADWQPSPDKTVRWPPGRSPQRSAKKGGGILLEAPKQKIPARPASSIEETLHQRSSLQAAARSQSSPLLLASGLVGASSSPQAARAVSSSSKQAEFPRTTTPTPLCVAANAVGRQDGYHAVLSGKLEVKLPEGARRGKTDDCVAWYRRKELENRCSLPSAEALEEASTGLPTSPSPSSSSWARNEASEEGKSKQGRLAPQAVSTLKRSGWKQVCEVSVWAEQARKIAAWRVGLDAPPSAECDRSVQARLKLLDLLERQRVAQGLDALRAALRLRFGSLEQAFAHLDVAGHGQGPGMLEMAGSFALLGLDVQSLCGCSDCELFRLLDVDCDGRVGLQDLLGTSTRANSKNPGAFRMARQKHTRGLVSGASAHSALCTAVAEDLDSWSNDVEKARDPEAQDRWTLLAKFIALSSWFDAPPQLRRRGRPEDTASSKGTKLQKFQPVTPAVAPPGGGEIGHGPATGPRLDDLHLLRFQKVQGSAVPEGWRLATHKEVRACRSDVLLLMDDWDVCGLAGGWRFDGAGYGNNLKEPYGPVDFSLVLVCRQESEATSQTAATSLHNAEAAPGGALARQQVLDMGRRGWAPDESDFENARRVLQLQFIARATARQFGEPLLSRGDVARLLGKIPPPGLTPNPDDTIPAGPSLAEQAEMYSEVLEMQIALTSFKGRALSKGLTFESLRALLQKLSLALGIHFRHLVDDAVDARAEGPPER